MFNVTSNMNNYGDLSIIPNILGGNYGSGYVNSINISAVTSSIDSNITPNNIANGVNILGVLGTFEGSGGGGAGDVKLFNTIEEMQASSGNREGDLAIVYGNTIQNCLQDSVFNEVIFPETVVLPKMQENNTNGRFVPAEPYPQMFDCDMSFNRWEFIININTEQGMYRVEYASSNGITYTRTTFNSPEGEIAGNKLVLPVSIIYMPMPDQWDDLIGFFMQVTVKDFEGLFENKSLPAYDKSVGIKVTDIDAINTTINYTYTNIIDAQRIVDILKNSSINTDIIFTEMERELRFFENGSNLEGFWADNLGYNTGRIGYAGTPMIWFQYQGSYPYNVYKISIDLQNNNATSTYYTNLDELY